MKKHQFTIFVLAVIFAVTAIVGKAQTCATAGCLDMTFGTGGKISFSVPGVGAVPRDIVVQSGGKTVSLLGPGSNSTFNLMRNNLDGSLDSSFGNNGMVSLTWGMTYKQFFYNGNARAVAIQNVGGSERFLVAGLAYKLSGNKVQMFYRIDRFMSDGTLDTSFGTGGSIFLQLGAPTLRAMAVQPNDQKIVTVSQDNSELVRLTANGVPDTTFGSGGKAACPGASYVAIDPNGTIIVASTVIDRRSTNASLRRYSSTGALDTSFGANGVATVNSGYQYFTLKSVAIDYLRNIIIGGRVENSSVSTRDFAVTRFTPAGFQDSSFSGDGFATAGFAGIDAQESSALVQSDGKIVLVVSVWLSSTPTGNYVDAGVARFNYDGSLDSFFGSGGRTKFDISGQDYVTGGKGGVIQIDPYCACEKIVVAGGNDYLTTFARLLTY